MYSETLTYQADGLTMTSLLYLDEARTGPRPGVLVFPEALGLGDHAKSRAERLAGLGYAALACDLHGDGKVLSDFGQIMSIFNALSAAPDRTRARAGGGYEALIARPEVDSTRIGAMGFCFGGTMALELARGGVDVAAIVGFHSGLSTARPEDAANIKGKVLVCIGAEDPLIPLDQRTAFEDEMRKGGVDWRMTVYGGVVHSFTNPGADALGRPEFARYDAKADARSWTEMRDLFDEAFAV